VEIFGTDYPTPDGTAVRDFIHVEDLARAHLLALEAAEEGKPKIYSVGNGAGFTVNEVVETARRVTKKSIKAARSPRRLGARRSSCPRTGRYRRSSVGSPRNLTSKP
jgi:UDP-glucose 4-epimerase